MSDYPLLQFHTRFRIAILLCMFTLSLLPIGCKKRQISGSAPEISREAAKYISEGDYHFRNSHLFGWRKAESSYQKAYAIAASNEIKKKLLLTRFLILIRQIDEDIPFPATEEVLGELCAGDAYQRALCAIAEWFEAGEKAGRLKLDSAILRGEDPALESYLNLLLFEATPTVDTFSAWENAAPESKESPLFLYLNTGKLTSMDLAEFDKNYPHFAEGLKYLADSLFQKRKYRSARLCYKKALDLIPDYVNSLVGLGNIYFYALEDYEQALVHYESALARDPSSVAALFGKSLALHQLGEYQESNATVDQMLAVTLTGNKWIDGVPDSQYYQGQAYYMKANNHHMMKDPLKPREFIDKAKEFLPESEEINYLSGLLFFQSNDLEPARQDFLRAFGRGSYTCSAQLHLGLIYDQLSTHKGWQPVQEEEKAKESNTYQESWSSNEVKSPKKMAVQYLVGSAACMESAVRSLKQHVGSVDSMDLDPHEQLLLKGRLQKKLLDMRISSCSTIEMIIGRISKDGVGEKDFSLDYLNEVLSRLRAE